MEHNGTQPYPGALNGDSLPPYAPDDEFKEWYSQRAFSDEIWVLKEPQKEEVKA